MKKLLIIFLDVLALTLIVYIFLVFFSESHNLNIISKNRRLAASIIPWGYCISIAIYTFFAHQRSFLLAGVGGVLAFFSLGVAITKGLPLFIVFMVFVIVIINMAEHFIHRYKVLQQFSNSDFAAKKALFQGTAPIPLEVDINPDKLNRLTQKSLNLGNGQSAFEITESFVEGNDIILVAASFWEKVLLLFDVNEKAMKIHSLNGTVDYQIKKGLKTAIEQSIRMLGQ
ncbi:MAG: hypothetical protein R2828_34790 [Saprospiraceae bacterium]